MSVEPLPDFTPAARKRWESIPDSIRQRLLANVWCGQCRHEARIIRFSGTIKGSNLLLVGKCAECRSDVARVIEGTQAFVLADGVRRARAHDFLQRVCRRVNGHDGVRVDAGAVNAREQLTAGRAVCTITGTTSGDSRSRRRCACAELVSALGLHPHY